jgi:hypothetical protein
MPEQLVEYLLTKVIDEYELHEIWSKISLNQCLSLEFIKKYESKLNLLYMIRNPRIKRKYLKLVYS